MVHQELQVCTDPSSSCSVPGVSGLKEETKKYIREINKTITRLPQGYTTLDDGKDIGGHGKQYQQRKMILIVQGTPHQKRQMGLPQARIPWKAGI